MEISIENRKYVKNIISEHFTTKVGRLNTQALTEYGFKKRNIDGFIFFKNNDLLNAQNLYNFINNVSEQCPKCENKKRFGGFLNGYVEYCDSCGRKYNNAMVKQGDTEFTNIEDLKDKRDMFSTSKIKKLSEKSILKIRSLAPHLDKDTKMAQVLYCIENEIKNYPKCDVCGVSHSRFISNKGYSNTCSKDCKWKTTDLTSRIKKQRSTFYEKYIEKYNNFEKENPEYSVEIFSKEFYLKSDLNFPVNYKHLKCGTTFQHDLDYQGNITCEKCYPFISTKVETFKRTYYEKYVHFYKTFKSENPEYNIEMFSENDYQKSIEHANVNFTHIKCGSNFSLNVKYQGSLQCPKCFPTLTKQQNYIRKYLENMELDVVNNDRQFIKPKEVDLLVHEHKFGIEYDSLAFHSFGKSDVTMFNTLEFESMKKLDHLKKTELVEAENYQLYRIFSNEWLNENKKSIWLSVIKSKCNLTERIYARKCNIKEVSPKNAKIFLDENHLQGNVNALIKIGLYFEEELVSLMTFGKSRRSKWKGEKSFELLRFCTKKNFTVVGGASRLLKQFERTHKPKLLISYANRRWSTGNLYNKLNFEFIENTIPNYFYFKGNDNCVLFSREKFMKHKLKDLLVNFDPKLTESLNMYNNNYRKIYDCGSNVFVKKYI